MISGIFTAIFLVLFVGGAIWIWQPKLNESMRQAAAIPLTDEEKSRHLKGSEKQTPTRSEMERNQ